MGNNSKQFKSSLASSSRGNIQPLKPARIHQFEAPVSAPSAPVLMAANQAPVVVMQQPSAPVMMVAAQPQQVVYQQAMSQPMIMHQQPSAPAMSSGRGVMFGGRESVEINANDVAHLQKEASQAIMGVVDDFSDSDSDDDSEYFVNPMEMLKNMSGMDVCEKCGCDPRNTNQICKHKLKEAEQKMLAMARPARVLPMPRLPITLIISGFIFVAAFNGVLFGMMWFTPDEDKEKYFSMVRTFNTQDFWLTRISDYLAIMHQWSLPLLTAAGILWLPFLYLLHFGKTDKHTKFSAKAVLDRMQLGRGKHYGWRFIIWLAHRSVWFFAIPAVIGIIGVAFIPENNAGIAVYELQSGCTLEGGTCFRFDEDAQTWLLETYNNGAYTTASVSENPIDWSMVWLHSLLASVAFGGMLMYALVFGIAFWIDECIDHYTQVALENEFYQNFPALAKIDGFKPRSMRKKSVVTWPSLLTLFLWFWSLVDICMIVIMTVDMADAYSFGGTTPSEWVFVLCVSLHIAFIPIALFFVVRRDRKKIRMYAKYRFAGKMSLKSGMSKRSMSNMQVINQMSFLTSTSKAQLGAGAVTTSMSAMRQKSFGMQRSKSGILGSSGSRSGLGSSGSRFAPATRSTSMSRSTSAKQIMPSTSFVRSKSGAKLFKNKK